MGFYFRKSISFGGVRFNFSKSGIGASVGVKGVRIGTGPRGNYIHMGRNGIYYRTAFEQKKTSPQNLVSQEYTPQHYVEDELLFREIESKDVSFIVDATSQDLINEINQKMKKISLWPFMLLLAFIPSIGLYIFIPLAIITYFAFDRYRKTTILFYDIREEAEVQIQQFYSLFEELMRCSKTWHVASEAKVRDRKYHAGASNLVMRSSIVIKYSIPPKLKTNVKIPCIPVGKQILYFFPDRILIYEGKKVGGLSYRNLYIRQNNQRFIESDGVPRDGTIVDRTWRYVNKSGGPDRRFKDNYQLPVMLYSDLMFSSSTGLNELIELSKQNAGKGLEEYLGSYLNNNFLA